MDQRFDLSLSPTGSNVSGTARITPELIAYHRQRAHALRADALACWARGLWRWATRRAALVKLGDCPDRDWLGTPARG